MVVRLLEISDNRKRLNSALWSTSNLGPGLIYLIYRLRPTESGNDRVSQAITKRKGKLCLQNTAAQPGERDHP